MSTFPAQGDEALPSPSEKVQSNVEMLLQEQLLAEKGFEGAQFELVRDNRPELCEPLLKKLQSATSEIPSLCDFPKTEWGLDVARPDWKPVDPDSITEELKTSLPFVGFETSQLRRQLWTANPKATGKDIVDKIWATYGSSMLAAIRKDPANLMQADVDADNDGTIEKVYRVVVLKRVKPPLKEGTDSWIPEVCPPSSPAHAIVFERAAREKMGTLAYANTMDHQDLIYIHGRTYSVWLSQRHIAIYEHVGVPGGTLFRRALCDISIKSSLD